MARRWTAVETETLIDNYHKMTIKELMDELPGKSQEAINNKIKRLKKEGKIRDEKDDEAVRRAYKQRRQ